MSGRQLVYLDESGDAGFKVGSGSSPALVVAAVILGCSADAEATAEAIHVYRRSIGRGRSFQFHFSNLCRDWRLGFLEGVKDCPFSVRAIVMRKDRIREGTHLRRPPKHFYNFTLKMLLTHTFGDINEAKVFVDGDAGRLLKRELGSYLRRECNAEGGRIIRELKFVPKRQHNVLMQLADIVTGSVARSYREDKTDRWEYRRVLGSKLKVWEFGKPEG
jgi:hypothetical protein